MFRRTGHLDVLAFFHRAMLEPVVLGRAVRIGISAIETDALQGRGDETEVTLIGELQAEEVGIIRIDGLGDFVLHRFSVFVQETCRDVRVIGRFPFLVHNDILHILVEKAKAHQSHALEIVFTTEVEVIGSGRLQVGITESCFLLGDVVMDARHKCRILGT